MYFARPALRIPDIQTDLDRLCNGGGVAATSEKLYTAVTRVFIAIYFIYTVLLLKIIVVCRTVESTVFDFYFITMCL